MRAPFNLALCLSIAAGCLAGCLTRSSPQAIYYVDNDPGGAKIISVPVNSQGMLSSQFSSTSTGGLGRYSTEGPDFTTPVTDQLTSQHAVIVSGNKLFTVNPGSNTVSLFEIDKNDPVHPKLVGEPASSGGDFPVSVAFSHALHVACVLNGGKPAGIQCYKVDDRGLHLSGSFIPLDLNQTSPPHGPANTASEIVFNPSNTALFVLVKGVGPPQGYFAAFPVVNGQVQPDVRVSQPESFVYQWGVSFINDTTAVVADPAIGAGFIEVTYPSLEVRLLKKAPPVGSGATCWTQYSERFDAVYLFDGYDGTIPVLDPGSGSIRYNVTVPTPRNQTTHAQEGLYDAIVAGTYLYVLGGVSEIYVISLLGSVGNGKTPTVIQTRDLGAVGPRRGWQGLAAWPNGL